MSHGRCWETGTRHVGITVQALEALGFISRTGRDTHKDARCWTLHVHVNIPDIAHERMIVFVETITEQRLQDLPKCICFAF